MRKSILLMASILTASIITVQAVEVTYTPDNTTIFKNPERGYTEELSYKVSAAHPTVVKNNLDNNWGGSNQMTLVMVLYNFNKFKAADIPSEVLAGFDEDMQILRDCGVKCVLRFAYTESQSDKTDATPEWVKRHLEQLQPHLAANADVIYVLEAGFIGSWGEWYYTTNYGNESQHMNSNRRKVIQYLFDNAPTDRFILFRYSMLKTEYFGDETPLSAEEGFSGTMRARWGCHNDAFLNNWGNDGTYASNDDDDDPAVRQFVATETLYVPNGGETNVESNSTADKVYAKAPEEMAAYHWSFCGKSYATQVTSRWKSSGIYDTLNIHMGYRYNLLDAQFSDQAAPGGKANITIRVRNSGYAPIYNRRTAYIVLKNGNKTYPIALKADPRRWKPNGFISWINEQIELPSNIAEGTYQLYLWLPDQYESIKNDPRFAVRFANTGVWDSSTGYNNLNASIVINRNAPMNPGELPEGVEMVEGNKVQSKKVIKDGQFFIVRSDGTCYTVLGQIIQ